MTNKNTLPSDSSIKDLETQIQEKIPKIFEGISNSKKNNILNSLNDLIKVEVRQEITQLSSFSGPIPPPDVLNQYIKINPDFAQTIIQMAVDEQKYAHSRDNKIIESSFNTKMRGQIYALIIAVIAITGGITCILFGYEISGSIVSGVGLTGLVSEFLGRTKKDEEHSTSSK